VRFIHGVRILIDTQSADQSVSLLSVHANNAQVICREIMLFIGKPNRKINLT